jgi:hypothetical protein
MQKLQVAPRIQPLRVYCQVLVSLTVVTPPQVGPCHHSRARSQVADGGTASDMEGSCEYIE